MTEANPIGFAFFCDGILMNQQKTPTKRPGFSIVLNVVYFLINRNCAD